MEIARKTFEDADEVRTFERGTFEVLTLGGMTIGRARYEPGWRWSEHVGGPTGQTSCPVSHVGMVVSGRAAVRMDDGEQFVLEPGQVFAIPGGHDSWVVGEEPYVSLHFLGADEYAEPD